MSTWGASSTSSSRRSSKSADDPAEEARSSWRRHFSRTCESLTEVPEADVRHTRWLAPSSRPHCRDEKAGVHNARSAEMWVMEARQRWVEQNPKSSWRSAPLETQEKVSVPNT